jgi:hypothetical protein|tara:strand:- start:286 stop:489 length:204 start_codon:yes stop_codon:yes gene_type:complete
MDKYIKLTEDNLQEYINTIYSVMHDEHEIENFLLQDFHFGTKCKNDNKKLFQIIDMLSELAFLNSNE